MSSTSCDNNRINAPGTEQGEKGDVDHVQMLSENLKSTLLLNDDYSDVHLVVEGHSFPAHKIILAARSNYFRALLFGGMRESRESEIELKGATTKSFKVLLKYVYTGRMALSELKEEVVLDVLGLSHQWGFEELESSICEYLQAALSVSNVCAILDTALAFGLKDLATTCAIYADTNAATLLDHPSLLLLSPAGVTELVSRDSFCASEDKIFECVCSWVLHNESIHPNAKEVLQGVRLPLMSVNYLLETVRPTNLISPDLILNAIHAQHKARDSELRYRGYLVPEENVAQLKHGAVVLKGEMRQAILDGDCQNYDVERGFTRHIIDETGDGCGGIVIKLRTQCILNHIRMLLWDRDLRSYSYYVEVSMDQEDWVRVVDHTKYHCRSWQNIFFPQRVVRYIKIVGTHNTVNRMFHVVTVEAYFTNKPFSIDPKWGLLVPKENVATIELSACVPEGVSRSRNALIDGKIAGYDWDSGYTCHQLGSGAIVVQLAQPYVISSMRLLLWDCDDRRYSFYVEVSANQRNWEMVANKSREGCKSWQTLRFPPIPVVYIRIVGTDNTANEVFHCVHFECPSQADEDLNGEEDGNTTRNSSSNNTKDNSTSAIGSGDGPSSSVVQSVPRNIGVVPPRNQSNTDLDNLNSVNPPSMMMNPSPIHHGNLPPPPPTPPPSSSSHKDSSDMLMNLSENMLRKVATIAPESDPVPPQEDEEEEENPSLFARFLNEHERESREREGSFE